MDDTEQAIQVTGVPIPKEGSMEFERMNKMAKKAVPLLLIIFTFGILEQQAFGMIFVNIGDQLGTPGLAPLITSIPGIILGIVCVIYGSLGDFVSLKKMTILGVIIFVLGSLVGFILGPSSIWAVVMARVLQAAGGQVAGSVFLVLVSKYISKENRVVYYGIFVAVFRFSAALGVVAAGYITKVDWRWLFAAPLLCIFFIPLLAKNLPDDKAEGATIDWAGFVLIGAFAGAVTMFFTDMTLLWGVSSLITLFLFVSYINKAKQPFLKPEFFKNKAFVVTMIVIFIGYFFSYTINAGVNAIGLNVYNIDSAEVSLLLVGSILLAAVLGFVCGPVVKKVGRSAAIIMALLFMSLGLVAIAVAIPYGKVWTLAIAPCLYYFGTSFFYSPIVDIATSTVNPEESGRVLGANDLVQAITGSIGVAVFGGMMSSGALSHSALAGVESGLASTYSNVFLVGGLIVFSALVLFISTKKMVYKHLELTKR